MGSEVWGIVRLGETSRWSGRLVRVRSRHRPTLAFEAASGVASLPLGTVVELGLAAPTMVRAMRCPAVLSSVFHRRDGVEIELDPDEPWLLTGSIPGLEPGPAEHRASLRVPSPASTTVVPVPVRVPSAEPSASHLVARLESLSSGGLGLLFPRAAEPTLATSRRLVCTLSVIPGRPPREWACDVRNRTLQAGSVRYGLEFVTELYEPEERVPRFEPLWDCPACSDPGLLADSHRFCPRCGTAGEGASTRLPDWDELAWAERHRYAGAERNCGRCGTAHAAVAVHCGHCGEALSTNDASPAGS